MADAGPTLLATRAELESASERIAREISVDHPGGVTLVGVLKGSVIFLADVARHLSVPAEIELVAVSPFDGAAGRTRVVKDVDRSVADRSLVLVMGLMDTGFTADFLVRHLRALDPSSVQVAVLANKTARRILPIQAAYVGVEVPDRFVVGWGLDYRGRYRNVNGLWAVDGASLADDPDLHVGALYGPRHTEDPPR